MMQFTGTALILAIAALPASAQDDEKDRLRNELRKAAMRGDVPGLRKASW